MVRGKLGRKGESTQHRQSQVLQKRERETIIAEQEEKYVEVVVKEPGASIPTLRHQRRGKRQGKKEELIVHEIFF